MKIAFDRPPAAADESGGMRVPYGAPRRNVPKWRWNLIVLLLLSPFIYFGIRALLAWFVVVAPATVVLDQALVKAAVTGRVLRLAPPGERVAAGAPVAWMDSPELTAQLGPGTSGEPGAASLPQREAMQAALERAGRLVVFRQERYATYRDLFKQGAATAADLANALAQLQQAELWQQQARADLAGMAVNAARERREADTQARQRALLASRGQDLVRSTPIAGTVLGAEVRPGDWVAAGSDLLAVVGDGEPQVEAYLDPARAAHAIAGREAELHFAEGTVIAAKVLRVDSEAKRPPNARRGPLDPQEPSLVVRLQPVRPLPASLRVHRLPLEVRFNGRG